MKKFVLVDLTDSETFDTETEARQRLAEWADYARKTRADARADADADEIARWDAEDRYYAENDDIAGQIRLYAVDLDVYDGDPCAMPDDTLDGCERLDTITYRYMGE